MMMMVVRPEIRISKLHFETPFQGCPLAQLCCHLAQSTWHLEIQVPGAGNWHLAYYQKLASGVSLKKKLLKCSSGILISGRLCTLLESYGPYLIQAILPNVLYSAM